MYGETANISGHADPPAGLSPHVRGNRYEASSLGAVTRSIPACTGKPSPRFISRPQPSVYPRMYGETKAYRTAQLFFRGLSPHVRGNLVADAWGWYPLGSIPACTGKPRAAAYARNSGSIPACTGKPDRAHERRGGDGVYPRMYGETYVMPPISISVRGLSPHVRGNRCSRRKPPRKKGSIPACTGKPNAAVSAIWNPRVYPRMYGGANVSPSALGLSPHVRGNRGGNVYCGVKVRSIPACTGKPELLSRLDAGRGVYPRMYGETGSSAGRPDPAGGLSPHVRGNRLRAWRRPGPYGSIPACTGKPAITGDAGQRERVYPRMYGETTPGIWMAAPCTGLSPHVRGNPRRVVPPHHRQGSIPACTGKPSALSRRASPHRVYPRMYGETRCISGAGGAVPGLSPHVRGNRAGARRPGPNPGSIPACTGKPCSRPHGPRLSWVYPRMYGETQEWRAAAPDTAGLSPHVRGNRKRQHGGALRRRSIPACTGKPRVGGGRGGLDVGLSPHVRGNPGRSGRSRMR